MRVTTPRMHVVKKEDKEAKVRDFIREALAEPGEKGPFLLMALSEDSPVARALASMAVELEQAGVSVRAVFAEASTNAATSEAASGLERVAIVRRASDVRLLDAHEQLILSDCCVWTGDCMRRNPSTRDAYETFAYDSVDLVVWGQRAFNQFWSKAKPLRLGKSLKAPAGASEVVPGEGALAATNGGDFTPAVGATRH